MAKRIIVALGLAAALVLGPILAGCAPQVDTENYVGSWELAYGSEEGLDTDTIALAKSMGSSVVLTLNEDGTGSIDMYGDVSTLTWTASSDTEGDIKIEGSSDATMKLEDGNLSIYDSNDGSLTFSRVQDA